MPAVMTVVLECRSAIVIASTVIALATSPAVTAEPSQQLLGKSVVISWSNTRQQRDQRRDGNWTEFRSIQGSHKLMICIGTAGHAFSRQVNTVGARSGTMDQVAGEDGGPYPARSFSFSGQTLTVVSVTSGGATRTEITFDPGFTSCTAQIMSGLKLAERASC